MERLGPRFLLCAGAVVGFTVALPLIHYRKLTFTADVTLGNLVQSAATIVTGLIVASYIQRNMQSDRKEKDILLSHLDSILVMLKDFERYKAGGPLTEVNSSLKQLSLACQAYCEMAIYCKYSEDVVNRQHFSSGIRALRRLATGTPIDLIEDHVKNGEMSTVVREGIIQLANEKKASLETELKQFRIRTFKTQVLLNRSYAST